VSPPQPRNPSLTGCAGYYPASRPVGTALRGGRHPPGPAAHVVNGREARPGQFRKARRLLRPRRCPPRTVLEQGGRQRIEAGKSEGWRILAQFCAGSRVAVCASKDSYVAPAHRGDNHVAFTDRRPRAGSSASVKSRGAPPEDRAQPGSPARFAGGGRYKKLRICRGKY
jgi:hypothetical protein